MGLLQCLATPCQLHRIAATQNNTDTQSLTKRLRSEASGEVWFHQGWRALRIQCTVQQDADVCLFTACSVCSLCVTHNQNDCCLVIQACLSTPAKCQSGCFIGSVPWHRTRPGLHHRCQTPASAELHSASAAAGQSPHTPSLPVSWQALLGWCQRAGWDLGPLSGAGAGLAEGQRHHPSVSCSSLARLQ